MKIVYASLALLCGCDAPKPQAKAKPVQAQAQVADPAVAGAQGEAESQPEPAGPVLHVVAKVFDNKMDGGPSRLPHFRLYRVGEQLLATVGPRMLTIDASGNVEEHPQWLDGLERYDGGSGVIYDIESWDFVTVGGRWPDGLYATLRIETGSRTGSYPEFTYRRSGDQWIAVSNRTKFAYWHPTQLAPWSDGTVLALRQYRAAWEVDDDGGGVPSDARMQSVAAAIGKLKKLIVLRGAGKAPDLGRQDFASFDSLESGEIVGVVQAEHPVAAHYDPATATTTEYDLPGKKLEFARVVLESPQRAWIFGEAGDDGEDAGPYLARFDGEAWKQEAAPPCDIGLASFSTAEGEQWAVCGPPPDAPRWDDEGSVWRRSAGVTWEKVELPKDVRPVEVVVRSRGDVWVAGDALLRTIEPAATLDVPGYQASFFDMVERGPPAKPFGCADGTVVLRGSADSDHAEVIAAIDGVLGGGESQGIATLMVVPFRSERRLGLQFHSLEKPVIRRLTKALGERIEGTYCTLRPAEKALHDWS